jgi:hypothetical protein
VQPKLQVRELALWAGKMLWAGVEIAGVVV